MGRRWRWVAAVAALAVAITSVAYAADDWYNGFRTVTLRLDGQAVPSDVPPIIMDGRTLLPVRALTEAMGHDVGWDNDTRTVSLATQPRLDSVMSRSGLRVTLLGMKQENSQEMADTAPAGRIITTVRFTNRGTGDQPVDLSALQLVEAGADGTRSFVVPHVLEVSGAKKPEPGTTKVVLAKGEEITAKLGYDIVAAEAAERTYRVALVNSSGEPVAALRVGIKITIRCRPRPCTITIEILF